MLVRRRVAGKKVHRIIVTNRIGLLAFLEQSCGYYQGIHIPTQSDTHTLSYLAVCESPPLERLFGKINNKSPRIDWNK